MRILDSSFCSHLKSPGSCRGRPSIGAPFRSRRTSWFTTRTLSAPSSGNTSREPARGVIAAYVLAPFVYTAHSPGVSCRLLIRTAVAMITACSASTSFDPGVTTHEFTPAAGWIDPTCSGDEYTVITNAECSTCADVNINSPAYALCDGNAYSVCSCEIPPGWNEVNYRTVGDDECCGDAGDATGDVTDDVAEASEFDATSDASVPDDGTGGKE